MAKPTRLLYLLAAKATREEGGFSIVFIILIVLSLILSGITAVSQAVQGSLASIFQVQSKEAREAAEIGMTRAISELNLPSNRRILVNILALSDLGINQIGTNNNLISMCSNPETEKPFQVGKGTTDDPYTFNSDNFMNSGSSTPNGQAAFDTVIINDHLRYQVLKPVVSDAPEGSREFMPDSYAEKNKGFNIHLGQSSPVIPSTTGSVTLRVRGIHVDANGKEVASIVLSKTFEVVPKCCARSLFGNNGVFGTDNRICDEQLGLLAGLARHPDSSPGGFTLTNAAFSVEYLDGSQVSSATVVHCNDCQPADTRINKNTGISSNMSGFTIDNPPAYQPIPDNKVNCATNSANPACTIIVEDNQTLSSENFSAWKDRTQLEKQLSQVCYKDKDSFDVLGAESGSTEAIYCVIRKLSIKADVLELQTTSSLPIRFYFPVDNETVMSIGPGQGTIKHVRNTSDASSSMTDLSFFGCGPTNCRRQVINLGTGNTAAEGFFSYFPVGDATLQGSAEFTGVLWSNTITATGGVDFQIPVDGLSDILSVINVVATESTYGKAPPLVDYVTRAVRSFRFF